MGRGWRLHLILGDLDRHSLSKMIDYDARFLDRYQSPDPLNLVALPVKRLLRGTLILDYRKRPREGQVRGASSRMFRSSATTGAGAAAATSLAAGLNTSR